MGVARFVLDQGHQGSRAISLSSSWPFFSGLQNIFLMISWPKLGHMQNHTSISGNRNGISQTGLVLPLLSPSVGHIGELLEVNGC